jgi:hypothetical protein
MLQYRWPALVTYFLFLESPDIEIEPLDWPEEPVRLDRKILRLMIPVRKRET